MESRLAALRGEAVEGNERIEQKNEKRERIMDKSVAIVGGGGGWRWKRA